MERDDAPTVKHRTITERWEAQSGRFVWDPKVQGAPSSATWGNGENAWGWAVVSFRAIVTLLRTSHHNRGLSDTAPNISPAPGNRILS